MAGDGSWDFFKEDKFRLSTGAVISNADTAIDVAFRINITFRRGGGQQSVLPLRQCRRLDGYGGHPCAAAATWPRQRGSKESCRSRLRHPLRSLGGLYPIHAFPRSQGHTRKGSPRTYLVRFTASIGSCNGLRAGPRRADRRHPSQFAADTEKLVDLKAKRQTNRCQEPEDILRQINGIRLSQPNTLPATGSPGRVDLVCAWTSHLCSRKDSADGIGSCGFCARCANCPNAK